jgi:thioredoxin-related protein
MRHSRSIPLLLLCMVLAGCGAHGGADRAPAAAAQPASPWSNDFDAAKAAAGRQGKDVLVFFTGSDWCPWCIRLRNEVLDTPEFLASAVQTFVLVEADFPRNRTLLPAAVQVRNEKLKNAFSIEGFPTVLLLDAQGRPYARTGYLTGGTTNYLPHLAALRQVRERRDAAWSKAEAAQGAEKARWLAEGLSAMDDDLVAACLTSVVARVKALDPNDPSGVVRKFEYRAKLRELEKSLSSAGAPPADAAQRVDAFIAASRAAGEELQKAMLLKLVAYPPRTADNVEAAIRLLEEMIAVDPKTATALRAKSVILPAALRYRERFQRPPGGSPPPTPPGAPPP